MATTAQQRAQILVSVKSMLRNDWGNESWRIVPGLQGPIIELGQARTPHKEDGGALLFPIVGEGLDLKITVEVIPHRQHKE